MNQAPSQSCTTAKFIRRVMPLYFSVNFTFPHRTPFSQTVIWRKNTGGRHTTGTSVLVNISVPLLNKTIIRSISSASGMEEILANSI